MTPVTVWYELKDYINAMLENPSGVICANCTKPNFMCDDCGWFVKDNKALCRKCFGPLTGNR